MDIQTLHELRKTLGASLEHLSVLQDYITELADDADPDLHTMTHDDVVNAVHWARSIGTKIQAIMKAEGSGEARSLYTYMAAKLVRLHRKYGGTMTDDDEVTRLNSAIQVLKAEDRGRVSDGYHTFEELYDFRTAYHALLCNEWALYDPVSYDVHKSWKHHDGKLCFGGGWFIVVAVLPDGQISNHYRATHWDSFKIPSYETAKYPFDGHTAQDVLTRLTSLSKGYLPFLEPE